jgi:choline transport protein
LVKSEELTTVVYSTAGIAILGWWLGAASVSNFVASMILDIAMLWHPTYEPQHWQQYMLYVALIWLAVAFNVFASRFVPLMNKLIFLLSAITLSATTLTLFVVARNDHSSAKFIFTDTTNQTGWSSNGLAFMLAIGNAVFSYLGSDCGAHMCEEIPNPGKNVPKVILFPLAMGLLIAFPFTAVLMYSITDVTAVLTTATGLPLLEIYYQGTGSKVGASFLTAMFAFCFFGCLVAIGK